MIKRRKGSRNSAATARDPKYVGYNNTKRTATRKPNKVQLRHGSNYPEKPKEQKVHLEVQEELLLWQAKLRVKQ